MKPLSIKEVAFTNFKNYSDAKFSLAGKFNLIYGLNGSGKTNLLDGIYYLCVGKSYFTGSDQKVVKYGEPFFRIEGDIHKGDERHTLTIKVKPTVSKDLVLDGVMRQRISDHLGFIPIVISAPKDIDLVTGTGQYRRKYFDHLLCQIDPAYLHALMHYNQILHLRTTALRQEFKDLKRIIDSYDQQISPHAQVIFEKRKWLRDQIQPLLQQAYKILSEDRENVSIEYDSRLHQYAYDILADQNWVNDRTTQRSNSGIHKDDFNLAIKDMPAKDYGSQGQIKSLIFALHLSKYNILARETGYKPILILDDIFDKLDEKRLLRLMEILILPEYGQILLSDTNRRRVGDFLPQGILNEIGM